MDQVVANLPDTDAGASPARTSHVLLSVVGVLVFAAILALGFLAYLSPAMLIEFASLRLCS